MAEHLARRYGGGIGEVLYPMPSDRNVLRPEGLGLGRRGLKIGFFGELGGNYEPVNALVDVLPETGAELHVFSHSSGAARQALRARDGVKDCGFTTPDELRAYFTRELDVILVPQGFDDENRLLRETCFPSKLPEATRFGLPLLIVAPPHGSAARWGREQLSAEFVVSDLNPELLKNALGVLNEPVGWERGREAVASAAAMFDPDLLQAQFEAALAATSKRPL